MGALYTWKLDFLLFEIAGKIAPELCYELRFHSCFNSVWFPPSKLQIPWSLLMKMKLAMDSTPANHAATWQITCKDCSMCFDRCRRGLHYPHPHPPHPRAARHLAHHLPSVAVAPSLHPDCHRLRFVVFGEPAFRRPQTCDLLSSFLRIPPTLKPAIESRRDEGINSWDESSLWKTEFQNPAKTAKNSSSYATWKVVKHDWSGHSYVQRSCSRPALGNVHKEVANLHFFLR